MSRLVFVFLCLAAVLKPCYAASTVTLDAHVGGDLQKTRFVAFLSKNVEYRIFSIVDPYRVVVDLPEVEIQVPGDRGRGLVLSSRAGLLSAGKSRIVIDLVEPALVEKAEIQPPENGLPARLVIDFGRSTHKAFLAASKAAAPPVEPKTIVAAQSDRNDKRPLIVIDPGHGGVDAGAHGRNSGTPEKDVTFDFSQSLRENLEKTGLYRIVMTRAIDVFVPLEERAEIASSQKADVLISIHADALDPKKLGVKGLQEVRGGTIYTLSDQASDEQANALAQDENKADVKAGVSSGDGSPAVSAEIESILNDLESRSKRNRSLALANYLISHLQQKMRFNIRPQRAANLRVLKATGVPAVLIELGYLSNDEDEKLLTSKEWRAGIAGKIADAVNSFMRERQVHVP